MKFLIKLTASLMLLGCIFNFMSLAQDKQALQDSLIRLHVVANSDLQEDQTIKLQVRDAVISFVSSAMEEIPDVETAKAWLRSNLSQIQVVANDALRTLGRAEQAVVTLREEAFPTRDYDTFSLPSGVYESLRITIGKGEGKNWWCVVFPSLCLPATGTSTEDVAAGAGFSDNLTNTITRQEGYQIRFFLLDVIGKIENFLFTD